MIRKLIVGATLAGAMATTAFATNLIQFDPDGTGGAGALTVSAFDWLPGDVLSYQSSITPDPTATPPEDGINDPFSVFYHAKLGTFVTTSGVALPVGELTVVAAFQEVGFLNNNTAEFLLAPVQTNNFFKIYFDATPDADNLAGKGFQANEAGSANLLSGSQLIFDGDVTALIGQSTFTRALVPVGTDVTATPTDGQPAFVANYLDLSPDGNQYPTVGTVVGSGATDLVVTPIFVDNNFFVSNPTQLIVDLFTNTSLVDPFRQVNPSGNFWDGSAYVQPTYAPAGLSVYGGAGLPGVLTMNGGPIASDDPNAYDFQFQGDANTSFDTTTTGVPEPGTMVLLGSGLLGLAGIGRRRMKK